MPTVLRDFSRGVVEPRIVFFLGAGRISASGRGARQRDTECVCAARPQEPEALLLTKVSWDRRALARRCRVRRDDQALLN